MRVILPLGPALDLSRYPFERSCWEARWIGPPARLGQTPIVVAYRRTISIPAPTTVRVHVSADERYELFLDGVRIGRGPERGDLDNWFFESYDLPLQPGAHTLVARTWWLGPQGPSPHAQMTVCPAFLLMAEGLWHAQVSTGVAEWECLVMQGYNFSPAQPPGCFCCVGARTNIDSAQYPWGFASARNEAGHWVKPADIARADLGALFGEAEGRWLLRPATLPAMAESTLHIGRVRHLQPLPPGNDADVWKIPVRATDHRQTDVGQWQQLFSGQSGVVVPPNSRLRVIVDLENYHCGYPRLITTGGAGSSLRLLWAEGLYQFQTTDQGPRAGLKDNRDEIENKLYLGMGDTFLPDGGAGRVFEPLWWEAGRYLELLVSTGDQPLTIDDIALQDVHYPHRFKQRFASSNSALAEIIPIALRTLEMCSQETYFDCPYYEQLMYVGDTRLQVLVTYATTRDDRLPRKAIEMFDVSRRDNGLTMSRYPTRVTQVIPPFSLWWVAMLHDFMMWRGDREFIAVRAAGMRAVLDAFRLYIRDDGLVDSPAGWNFMDWVPGWDCGIPPVGHFGPKGSINWLMVLVLNLSAELEDWLSEPELAARNRRQATSIADAAMRAFWDESRGLIAEDITHQHFSEHSQCLALLSGQLSPAQAERVTQGLLSAPDLARSTVYFTHYLFETLQRTGHMERFIDRMALWFELKAMGFKTTVEAPEPSRSDCHAWGAHPVYHYFTSILGIRPASAGFATVRVQPQLGSLTWAEGELPHPLGIIHLRVDRAADGNHSGTITLPAGLSGELVIDGTTKKLGSGKSAF